jgi:hypothetical protein
MTVDKKKLNELFSVTDEQLDAEAKEYEDGTWSAPLGKPIMGRPSIANEEVRLVTVRLPLSKIHALEKRATEKGSTRSQAIREAVDKYLASA